MAVKPNFQHPAVNRYRGPVPVWGKRLKNPAEIDAKLQKALSFLQPSLEGDRVLLVNLDNEQQELFVAHLDLDKMTIMLPLEDRTKYLFDRPEQFSGYWEDGNKRSMKFGQTLYEETAKRLFGINSQGFFFTIYNVYQTQSGYLGTDSEGSFFSIEFNFSELTLGEKFQIAATFGVASFSSIEAKILDKSHRPIQMNPLVDTAGPTLTLYKSVAFAVKYNFNSFCFQFVAPPGKKSQYQHWQKRIDAVAEALMLVSGGTALFPEGYKVAMQQNYQGVVNKTILLSGDVREKPNRFPAIKIDQVEVSDFTKLVDYILAHRNVSIAFKRLATQDTQPEYSLLSAFASLESLWEIAGPRYNPRFVQERKYGREYGISITEAKLYAIVSYLTSQKSASLKALFSSSRNYRLSSYTARLFIRAVTEMRNNVAHNKLKVQDEGVDYFFAASVLSAIFYAYLLLVANVSSDTTTQILNTLSSNASRSMSREYWYQRIYRRPPRLVLISPFRRTWKQKVLRDIADFWQKVAVKSERSARKTN